MNISVKVKTNAKKEFVEKIADDQYLVSVSAQPQEGKANASVIKLLADFLNVPKSEITLIRGKKSKNKVFSLLTK